MTRLDPLVLQTPCPSPLSRQARAAMLVASLVLAACSAAGDEPRAAVQAPDTVVARFAAGGEVSVVEVSVDDRRPLRSAELVGPGGVIVAASSIDSNRASLAADQPFRPSGTVGGGGGFALGGGGGFGFGTGAGVPVPLTGAEGPNSQAAVSGQIRSTALLRLPDPLGYRLEWQQWQVRVQIGDPPDVNYVTLPAPQPPASL
jgi:hypothetical protein